VVDLSDRIRTKGDSVIRIVLFGKREQNTVITSIAVMWSLSCQTSTGNQDGMTPAKCGKRPVADECALDRLVTFRSLARHSFITSISVTGPNTRSFKPNHATNKKIITTIGDSPPSR
jgi:hypothetical protein